MKISKLDDKTYNNFKTLFNHKYNKFILINDIILYNFQYEYKKICNINFISSQYEQIYSNIILKKAKFFVSFKYENLIPFYNNSNNYLIITNISSIIINNYNNNKNIDCIYIYDQNRTDIFIEIENLKIYKENKNITSELNIYLEKSLYLQFLKI